MKTKKNNKAILAILLILIIAGLALACIGAIKSLSMGLPGITKPEQIEGMETIGMDTAQPMPDQAGNSNPTDAAEPNPSAVEGEEPPAENGEPINDINMSHGAGDAFSFAIVYIVPILIYILLLIYVLMEYKRPHGNLLRVTLLIYAFMLAVWAAAQGENAGCIYVLPCTTVIVAYLSGRLNKIKKNIVWFSIAAAFLIGYGILQTVMVGVETYGIMQISYCFGAFLQWITLALAYFSRYKEHKEAGLMDAPKK